MSRNLTACLLLVSLALLPAALAQRETSGLTPRDLGSVTVTATGTAYGEPDEASFDVGVSVLNADVEAATAEVSMRVSSLLTALQTAGVATEDIRTSSFSVYPEQGYDNNGQPTRLRYRVTNVVHVTVRSTARLGELLGRSVTAGANEVSSVVYTFSDQRVLEGEARTQAMTQAREKAAQLARLGGAELGRVRRIGEGIQASGDLPVGMLRFTDASADGAQSVPVSSGQLAVTVNVEVVYHLK